jgi:deoxyribodipyrimidine photo-lyase
MDKKDIAIVWFKRDLRIDDNEAIFNALKSDKQILFIYLFENALINDSHYSQRHWQFIKESLLDLNLRLENYQTKVLVIKGEIEKCFEVLREFYNIHAVYSHQETGLKITFDRDKAFKKYTERHGIKWVENINNGVFRGLKNRKNWVENWEEFVYQPVLPFQPQTNQFLGINEIISLEKNFEVDYLKLKKQNIFQPGGSSYGQRYANSFFDTRFKNYMFHISKPLEARTSCSRLSPYIAWGNLSIRQIYQQGIFIKGKKKDRHLNAFLSRLRWQAHFIQKFEMESRMEFESINRGFLTLKKPINEKFQQAWQLGQTGFPLIDAAMRCLNETGWVNFRMRAMLVSFFTHNLWQPWQNASSHLAQQFLDFEPGIHYSQLQMQAGETGINTLRIYNPIKNSLTHDEEARFIKKWVPELAKLPVNFIHEPWTMTPIDQVFSGFELGENYPLPIINLDQTRKYASDILWGMQKNDDVKKEAYRVLKKHTLSNRFNS